MGQRGAFVTLHEVSLQTYIILDGKKFMQGWLYWHPDTGIFEGSCTSLDPMCRANVAPGKALAMPYSVLVFYALMTHVCGALSVSDGDLSNQELI